jgi:short-subunit dehydrogenase
MNHYSKKSALIVGGSEGIGKSIAEKLVTAGCQVSISSRSNEKLELAKYEISKSAGSKNDIHSFAMDVTDAGQCETKLQLYLDEIGTPDFLFNCAGFARPGYFSDLELKYFREMMDLNYFGSVHTIKAILPKMLKRGSGHIINTSSIAGFIGLFGYTGYCASKYAVIGFSEALRREMAPLNIRVSVLCPPNTRTPGLDRENEFKPREVLATEEKAKVVDPDYVAKEVLKRLPKNPFLMVPTLDGALAHRLSRHLPGVLDLFVKRPSLD